MGTTPLDKKQGLPIFFWKSLQFLISRVFYNLLPVSNLYTIIITAITKRMWIIPPIAGNRKKPNNQPRTSMTTINHKMFPIVLLFLVLVK